MKTTLGEFLASGQWTTCPGLGSDTHFTFLFSSAQARAAFQKKFAGAEIVTPESETPLNLDKGESSKQGSTFVLIFKWDPYVGLREKIIEIYRKHVRPGVGVGENWFHNEGHLKLVPNSTIKSLLEEMRRDGTLNFRKRWYYLAEMDDHHEDRYNGEPT